jgi:hypothetical protein
LQAIGKQQDGIGRGVCEGPQDTDNVINNDIRLPLLGIDHVSVIIPALHCVISLIPSTHYRKELVATISETKWLGFES